jgi:cytochrome bd ubiquinol oxidase subunit I
MIGFGALAMLVALVALWSTRRGRLPAGRRLWVAAVSTVAMPLLANSFGWIFTEVGRQPWTVFGLFKTADSGSPSVATSQAAFSVILLTLVYGGLAVIELVLMLRYAKAGAPEIVVPGGEDDPDAEKPLAFAY